MIEQHDLDEGQVYDDCLCRPGDAPHSTEAPLPAWCYSPDGTECTWYGTCLERRFPCIGSGTSYALEYGEKFCNLYTENYDDFDKIGQKWIDAVRKCLQVALVPLLRPYNHPSCEEIKDAAFRSHSGCYVSPYPDAPSFCDIGWSNYWKVFWTIKSAFASNFWDTVGQGLITAFGCISHRIAEPEDIHMLKFTVEQIRDDSVEKLEQSLTEYIPEHVTVYVFQDSNRRKRSTDPSNSIVMNVLLFDRLKYDLNYKNVSNISFDGVITQLEDDIKTGQYQLDIGVPIEEISFCPDIECHNITRTVVPGSEKESTVVPDPEQESTVEPGPEKESTVVPGPEKESTVVPGPEKKSTVETGPEVESNGLSIGVIIGIVVGVIIGVVVLGALGFLFIRKM